MAKSKHKGVIKFTYHSPRSELPIPDFAGDKNDKGSKKTEAHFFPRGMMAENFLKKCYQRTIKAIVEHDIPYLFWVSRKQEQKGRNPQVITGFLECQEYEERPSVKVDPDTNRPYIHGAPHITVYGKGHLYRFEDALPTEEVFGKALTRIDFMHRFLLDKKTVDKMLKHFSGLDNIVEECAVELARLDTEGYSCYPDLCDYKEDCPRYTEGYGMRLLEK